MFWVVTPRSDVEDHAASIFPFHNQHERIG